MLDAIIRWSIQYRWLVLFGAALLIIAGIAQTRKMPVDVFPDLTAPSVTVITEAHGMAPEEVERLITTPIEASLNGASGVRRVRSSTSVGISVVWVEFNWGTDLYIARQIVNEKLQLVQASLPPEVEPPTLGPISSIMGEILFIGLSSEQHRPEEVRTVADWEVRRRLLAVPGVSQVIPIGGGVQQLQVQVRPQDLVARGIPLEEVVQAVQASNENTSAGFYTEGGQERLIYGLGRVRDAEDLQRAVVRDGDVPILLGDVASVAMGRGIQRGDASIQAAPGVILGIQKQPGVNTLELTQRLDETLDSVERGLPPGMVLHRDLVRQADFIETSVDNVSDALRDGAILVVLIVGLFLLSGRATLITALAIPLSLLTATLTLNALGISLNTMTLGGMAIAVGALVDDAIIDVENVVRRLRERSLSPDAATPVHAVVFEASREIRGSIVFATLIILLVFLPLFFLEGVEGRLMEPLGLAYVIALAASLVVALTVTPALCALLLPGSRAVRLGIEPRPVRWLRAAYERLLVKTFRAWPALVALSLLGVAVAGLGATRAGRTFLPAFNEGALTISAVTFSGTSLEDSNLLGRRVETILLQHPEVQSTARRTGRAELDEHAQGIHASEIDVRLKLQSGRRSKEELLDALRDDLAALPGVRVTLGQPISHRIDHMLSGTRANIAVKVFGPDLGELRRIAEGARAEMEQVPGVVDLAVEEQAHLPFTAIRFKRDALALHGLQVRQVAEDLETAFYGRTVSRILQGPYAFDLVVRYPEEARSDLDTIGQTLISTPRGAWVPLEALADLQEDRGPDTISHENGQRKLVVLCNVGEGRDLGGVVNDLRARIDANVPLPPGYSISYGGQFEAAEEATRTLLALSALVILGIFGMLYAALRSTRDATLVMLNLPLALIGGVAGVFVSDGVISIASLIGFMTLFGIATRNGIMMITHMRHLVESEGVRDPHEAILRGASERLAPILMTALASGLGLIPLALAGGEPGSELQAPMAMVILFGLISSTLLNMFVIPALALRFSSLRSLSPEGPHAEPLP